MCEYCGCQNIPAIAALTREHDAIRGVAREAVHATRVHDRFTAAAVARQLRELLAPHTAIEERGLFPAMAGDFAEHVASLQAEHRHLEETLAGIADPADGSADWQQRLSDALAELFNHILREQDGLFPATLTTLTPEQWETLELVRSEVTACHLSTRPVHAEPTMTPSRPMQPEPHDGEPVPSTRSTSR